MTQNASGWEAGQTAPGRPSRGADGRGVYGRWDLCLAKEEIGKARVQWGENGVGGSGHRGGQTR